MSETLFLKLPLLAAEQAQKHVTVNEALGALDALVQLSVKDRDLATPPMSLAEGDRYIVAVTPTGAWAGHAAEIAVWSGGAWAFHTPREGWRCWADDENAFLIFNGSSWVDWGAALGILQNLALLGIGTSADAANPFSAKLNKALWTAKSVAEGGDGDLRCTMSKEAAGDVLSLLMQRGFSGRAELGLIGDDDFAVKVSADGAAWKTALAIDRATGSVSLPCGTNWSRERLTADRTYYVRADGSNGNDGLADTAGRAFATIQKAVDAAATIDLAGRTITIRVGAGSYGGVDLASLVGGNAQIIGDEATPANCLVAAASDDAFGAVSVSGQWTIAGFKVTASGGTSRGVAADASAVHMRAMEFGACAFAQIHALNGGIVTFEGNYTISGGGQRHFAVATGGTIRRVGPAATVTVSGTPAFSAAFAFATSVGVISAASLTFSGASTGTRYSVDLNAVMLTNGGGASYFPGSAAGSAASGGQYA